MGRVSQYLRQQHIGLIALFISLGGVAWAATAPPNSVRSSSIQDGQVKRADLDENAVNSAKVAPDSLTGDDIDETSLQGTGAGTVTEVDTGPGLTGGPITEAGSISLSPCPTGQFLKSVANGDAYVCSTDSNTTYTAGTGLELSGGQFSIAEESVTGTEIKNGLLRARDVGRTLEIDSNLPSIANGRCDSPSSPSDSALQLGDYAIGSAQPALPEGVILTANVKSFAVTFQVCNFTGAALNLPLTTFRALAFRN